MARYTVQPEDRWDRLAEQTYGAANDAALMTIARANQDTWTGDLVTGEVIELPDALGGITAIPSPFTQNGTVFISNGTKAVDWDTGQFALSGQAIRDAVVSRCLTILGDKWFYPDYGSQTIPLGLSGFDDNTRVQLNATIGTALQPDEDWYTLNSIDYLHQGSNLLLTVTVSSGSDVVPVQISVPLGG